MNTETQLREEIDAQMTMLSAAQQLKDDDNCERICNRLGFIYHHLLLNEKQAKEESKI